MTEVVCGTRDGDSESELVKAGVTADADCGIWPGDCSDVPIPGPGMFAELLTGPLSIGTVAEGTLPVDVVKEGVSPATLLPALESSPRVVEDTGGGLPVGSTELLRVDASTVNCEGWKNPGVVLGS